MPKPKIMSGYNSAVTDACERVLVTLLRGLGVWKKSIFLVGGLTPRYLVTARPPKIPHHAGTGDIDVVVDVEMLTDMAAYATLQDNLFDMGFTRVVNDKGHEVSWQWEVDVEEGAKMRLEFLADSPKLAGSKVMELPTDSKVTALNIPHSSMVFDLHETMEITADLLGDNGRATEVVRYANIVSFTCLKAFAFDQRNARKDAHDLIYCLEHHEGGLKAAQTAFREAMDGKHGEVIREALARLTKRFCDANPDESYLRDGPVAVSRFEDEDADAEGDADVRNRRILRQRQVADLMNNFLGPLA